MAENGTTPQTSAEETFESKGKGKAPAENAPAEDAAMDEDDSDSDDEQEEVSFMMIHSPQ